MKLNKKLEDDKKMKEKIDQTEKDLIHKALDAIKYRLDFRNIIRRFEAYFGMRKYDRV